MGRPLLFALNGERVEVAHPDPSMTLLSYIRTFTPFRGTKLGCGEGGCGACVVLLARYDAASKRVEESTINSCLAPVCSLDLCSITTTEGLGSSRGGLHAVHQRLAGFHASQCGFCTPGMTMSMFGCLRQAGPEGPQVAEAELAVQGNICRCTGYRPILDACKSFAKDVDLEDLGVNTFCRPGEVLRGAALPAYDAGKDPKFPQFLVEVADAEREWDGARFLDTGVVEEEKERAWIRVKKLRELFGRLKEVEGCDREVRLVVGNTSQGIYKDARPQVFVDISGVPELLTLKVAKGQVEVGAAVSISKFIRFLEESAHSEVYPQLAVHLHKLASVHVRNRASVGGNLIMAQQRGFDSDLATILLGAGASLRIASSGGEDVVSVEEFLERGALEKGSVLVSVLIPTWNLEEHSNGGPGHVSDGDADSNASKRVVFKTYRASPRPLGNAVSYVNAALLARIQEREGKHAVRDVRLAFGAFGSKHAVLARDVQEFLAGKEISAQVLLEAISLLKASVLPAKGTHKAAYRASVVVGYFFDFFRPFLGPERLCENGWIPAGGNGHVANGDGVMANGNGQSRNGKGTKSKTLSRAKQQFEEFDEFFPVGRAAPKMVAELQASGEAVYVDDIPSPEGCLYAAFVVSEHALAEVTGIDASQALASPGAVALVTADDIPEGGLNRAMNIWGITESLFATDKVEFHGHPVAILVADSYQHASDAAGKVIVAYDTEKLGPPILTVEDAVARSSFLPVPPFFAHATTPVGDSQKALAEAELKIENGEVSCGSQYHFYMETNTALAVPDEDGQIVVYSACQGTEFVQQAVAECLGIPMHNVRAITRRIGGGFGGKGTKACTVATACAVAAWKLKRPVRMFLDRKTDMLLVGGRHPMKATYSVGFTKEGKVTALQAKVDIIGGWSPDLSMFIPLAVHSSLKKYDWGAFSADYRLLKTNHSSKTTVRGPGDVQGAFFGEAIIQHVAAFLGLTAQEVRDKNSHTLESASAFWGPDTAGGPEGFTLPEMWARLKTNADLNERQTEIQSFNSRSRWSKRGLAMVPTTYVVHLSSRNGRVTCFADGSVAVEAGGIEMGQGLYTKVRQAAAFGLGQLWDKPGGVDISKIRVVQADSISLGNGGISGGSTTSETNCAGVLAACKMLVQRLKPIKQKLEEGNPDGASWEAVVGTAKLTGVDLSAQTISSVGPGESSYLTVGAAVSEVEVNVLTGETVILRTDLIYDAGKSLNPAVDIGQVEGAFVQGIGFFLTEEILVNAEGRQLSEGTWLYKPPTIDNIPRIFNVELLNSPAHKTRILSGKASGEPPLLLAASVHSAVREAIAAARKDLKGADGFFQLDSPATLDKVKSLCGLDNVEQYLASVVSQGKVLVH